MIKKLAMFAAIGLALTAGNAMAAISNDTFKVDYYYPSLATLYNAVGELSSTSPSVEFMGFKISLTNSGFDFKVVGSLALGSANFNGFVLTDLSGNNFSNVSLASGGTALTNSNLTYTSSQIKLNLQGQSFSTNTQSSIVVNAVPGPTAGTGLGAVALAGLSLFLMRRRRSEEDLAIV